VISMRPPLVARPLRLCAAPLTTTDCGAQNLAAGVIVADQAESGTGVDVYKALGEATVVPIVSNRVRVQVARGQCDRAAARR